MTLGKLSELTGPSSPDQESEELHPPGDRLRYLLRMSRPGSLPWRSAQRDGAQASWLVGSYFNQSHTRNYTGYTSAGSTGVLQETRLPAHHPPSRELLSFGVISLNNFVGSCVSILLA